VQHSTRRPVTTNGRHGYAGAPHLLARQFDVAQSDRVWVGAITYLWTQEGWLYLSDRASCLACILAISSS
jgi:putative transposase